MAGEITGNIWSCRECSASGSVAVTGYRTGEGIQRTIPVEPNGGLSPLIQITCPACSGVGVVVGHTDIETWNISKSWLEARLKETQDDHP